MRGCKCSALCPKCRFARIRTSRAAIFILKKVQLEIIENPLAFIICYMNSLIRRFSLLRTAPTSAFVGTLPFHPHPSPFRTAIRSLTTKKPPPTTFGKAKPKSPTRKIKYKLKNHKGAVARWLPTSTGFKRQHAGKSHLNRKAGAMKRIFKRTRVVAEKNERKLLKTLIPYFKKRYLN